MFFFTGEASDHTFYICSYMHYDSSLPTSPIEKKSRLAFIDVARSIAILMMLEGHCTGEALGLEFRQLENPIYNAWYRLHGLTSPLFFTLSGLIFTYLLLQHRNEAFFSNPRVKKGMKRVLELFIWGYLLQLDLRSVYHLIFDNWAYNTEWLQAFHVLQSIALGLFFLMLIYGLHCAFRKWPLAVLYLLGALVLFGIQAGFNVQANADAKALLEGTLETRNYWPPNGPLWLQNMFYGQYSQMSFLRYGGFVLLGGMLGSIFRTFEEKVFSYRFIFAFIGGGLLIRTIIDDLIVWLDSFLLFTGLADVRYQQTNISAFRDFGWVVMLVGCLILINRFVSFRSGLFIKMGQNTLPIYILHVIILFGGLFGYGLKPHLLHQQLSPWTTVLVSASFIAFFFVFIYFYIPLERFWKSLFHRK